MIDGLDKLWVTLFARICIRYPIIYDINNGLFIFSVAMSYVTCYLPESYAEITSLQHAGRFRVFADAIPISLIDQLCRCNP